MKNILIVAIILLGVVGINAQKNWEPVPNSYIVVVKKGKDLKKNFDKGKGRQKKMLSNSIHGYTVKMSKQEALETAANPEVDFVEPDRYIAPTELTSSWGLDRIDQRGATLDGQYIFSRTGEGASIYIMDTGINFAHEDFEGRASLGQDYIGDGQNGNDCYGHGTHVAGIAGSKTYGVAKKSKLYAMRIGDCQGWAQISYMIAAIDWINANHTKPAVVNLSYGFGGISPSLTLAFQKGYQYGVVYVVAAGNSNWDSCQVSPSNVLENLVVGATVTSGGIDYRAGYSNHGTCVDILAPGNGIPSTYIGSPTAARNMSGTSMAAPFVAGVAASYLSSRPLDSPDLVQSMLISESTKDVIQNMPADTANRLLFDGFNTNPTAKYPVCSDVKMNGTVGSAEKKVLLSFSAPNNKSLTASIAPQNGLSAVISLEQQKGQNWNTVTPESTSVSHTAKKGNYRWIVRSTFGAGGFNFCYN